MAKKKQTFYEIVEQFCKSRSITIHELSKLSGVSIHHIKGAMNGNWKPFPTLLLFLKGNKTIVRHKVLHRGALIVNRAILFKRGANVCAINVDMKSKRGNILCVGTDGYAPTIAIEAGEGSDYLNKKVKRDVPTEISFPDFKGWDVWSAMICKHSVYVCLVKNK